MSDTGVHVVGDGTPLDPLVVLPKPLAWGIASIKVLGTNVVLVAVLLYFVLYKLDAKLEAFDALLRHHMTDVSLLTLVMRGSCLNDAESDLEVARCNAGMVLAPSEPSR